jgi:hypothetical protein
VTQQSVAGTEPSAARHWVVTPVAIFAVSRVAVFLTAWFIRRIDPSLGYGHMLANWDGNWNTIIATHGYAPVPLGPPVFNDRNQTLAFLPVLPVLTGVVHHVTGAPVRLAGVTIATVAALAGMIFIYRLVANHWGDRIATRSVLLLSFAPYAFVLSMFYTEGFLLLAAAVCFLALDRRWWVAAGGAALVGGLCRPNGFLLTVPCVVVAVGAVRSSRDWRALLAPALAPVGFFAWLAYVWKRTGSPKGYFNLQDTGWGARIDWGRETWNSLWAVTHGWYDKPEQMMTVVAVIVAIAGIVLMVRQGTPLEYTSYAIAVTALIVLSHRQASAGRYVLSAFPIAIAYARALSDRVLPSVIAVSAVLSSALFTVATVGSGISP